MTHEVGSTFNRNPRIEKQWTFLKETCAGEALFLFERWLNSKSWYNTYDFCTLATSCEELTHWKRLWCWKGLGAEGEGDDGGWDGWMASLTRWTWVWVNSGSWWWTGRPGVLRFMGSQRIRPNWATELILHGAAKSRTWLRDWIHTSRQNLQYRK